MKQGLVAVGIIAALFGSVEAAQGHDIERTWEGCKYEDSNNCVWDAKHMGNGEGKSFKVSRKGNVTYITHKRARHLLNRHGS